MRGSTRKEMNKLEVLYHQCVSQPSDINEHAPMLYRYGRLCRHITEFGTRAGVSTAGFLYARPDRLVAYDVCRYPQVDLLQDAASEAGIEFAFHQENVLETEIEPTDLLFVDTLHTYDQTRVELARHGNRANKYIILHDTETFAFRGEVPGSQGMWPAISEFLRENPHWSLIECLANNNGVTVLSRSIDRQDSSRGESERTG